MRPCVRREETSAGASPGVRCWQPVAHRHSYAVVDFGTRFRIRKTQWGLLLFGVVIGEYVVSCNPIFCFLDACPSVRAYLRLLGQVRIGVDVGWI